MQCEQFMEYAPEWMEGARSAEALSHRSACPRCSSLVADLEAIQRAAPLLAQSVAEPPERVWLAIRAELEAEGILQPRRTWLQRLTDLVPAVPRPALVGVYAALFAVSALLAVTIKMQGPALESAAVRGASPEITSSLSAQLEKVEQNTIWSVHAHNPAVAASYRQNMAIVDNFITVCEKRIEEDPQNGVARDYLLSAYQQKADLLASIMERGAQGD